MTTAQEVTKQLAALLRREHEAMADFIVALADFDRRGLWAELGHNSLFWFLHRELGLSKGAAQYRKIAAELAERVPQVVEPLRDGRLCLTTIVELANVLTPDNREQVLPRFFGLSRQEAAAVVAELQPAEAPPQRDVVTAVRAPVPTPTPPVAEAAPPLSPVRRPAANDAGWLADLPGANSPSTSRGLSSQHAEQRDAVEPLTADLRRLHLTVDRECLDLFSAARDLLSHSDPDASSNDILKAALRLLIADREKKKAAVVERPRKDPPPSSDPDDAIPASVKRAVWTRDGGRCPWALANGGICACTTRLEYAHIKARADGGLPTIDNIRLLCRFHNQHEARLRFGDAFMDRVTREAQQVRTRRTDVAPTTDRQPCLDLGP